MLYVDTLHVIIKIHKANPVFHESNLVLQIPNAEPPKPVSKPTDFWEYGFPPTEMNLLPLSLAASFSFVWKTFSTRVLQIVFPFE